MTRISERILNIFKMIGQGIGFIIKMFMSLAIGIFESFNEEPKKTKKKKRGKKK